MKNLKEFKELIIRYETITLEEIKKEWNIRKDVVGENEDVGYYTIRKLNEDVGYYTIRKLTGFGSPWCCTLCQAAKTVNDIVCCDDCVYGESYGCFHNENEKTYQKIEDAKTPKGLLTAIRNRAKHLRKSYKEIL